MIVYDKYSFNTSREIDPVNGYLRVTMSNISKAQIRPYLGREIPEYERFNLDPNKIYNVLCPKEELEKAAKTFNNLPLTREHIEVDVDDVPKDKIVGSLGDHATVEGKYLKNNLIIYDKKDIDMVLSGKRKELSCGYRYTPVQESGEYEGQHYDFKMTDIIGNHVALVKQGRAGRDVMVADSSKGLLETIKEKIMSIFDSDIIEDAEEKKEDEVEWITVRGNHIPVSKGQSKEEAINSFLEKQVAQKNHERKEAAREESKMKPETVKARWEKEKKDAESTIMKYEQLVKENPDASNYKDVLEGAKKRLDEANSNIGGLKEEIKGKESSKEESSEKSEFSNKEYDSKMFDTTSENFAYSGFHSAKDFKNLRERIKNSIEKAETTEQKSRLEKDIEVVDKWEADRKEQAKIYEGLDSAATEVSDLVNETVSPFKWDSARHSIMDSIAYSKKHPESSDDEKIKKLEAAKKIIEENAEKANDYIKRWGKNLPKSKYKDFENDNKTTNDTDISKQEKVGVVMKEFKEGELKSGSGEKVTDPKQAIAIALSEADKVAEDEIPDKQDEPKKAGEESALQQGEEEMAEEVKEEVKTEKKVETPAEEKPVEDACSKDAEIKEESKKEEEVVEDKEEKDLKGKEKKAFAEGVDYGEKKEKEEPKKLDSEHESEGAKKADKEEKEEKKEEKKEEMAKDSALVMDADALRAEGREQAMADFKCRDTARKAVKSIVGDVDIFAFDSAEEIYKFACKEAGMNLDEIASYKDAFAGLQAGKAGLAMDASPVSGSNDKECFKDIRLA